MGCAAMLIERNCDDLLGNLKVGSLSIDICDDYDYAAPQCLGDGFGYNSILVLG